MSSETRRDFLISAILITSVLTIAISTFISSPSADLMAVYLAAEQFAAGNFDQIYSAPAATFDLSVPDTWRQLAEAQGLGDIQLFPFIYPPLWAAAFGSLTEMASPTAIFTASHVINPVLLLGTIFLAWRILRPSTSLALWLLLGILAIFPTIYGFIALHQSQPQIFVSFLIVLAIERSRYNRPVSAGMVMALAASIKLYPLLFVAIWVATGQRRSVKSFFAFGLLLGITSLALGGIDLHFNFLKQISTINDTILLTQLTLNFDALLGQFFLSEAFSPNAQAAPHLTGSTGVNAVKPMAFEMLSKALLLTSIVVIAWRASKSTETAVFRQFWPALLILVSLFGPLSWAYHYITAVVFIPSLLLAGPRRLPFWLSVILLIALSIPGVSYLSSIEMNFYLVQAIGTIGTALLALTFLLPLRIRS